MRALLIATLAALAVAGSASAQGSYFGPNTGPTYGPGYRSNLSPYLNLSRNFNAAPNAIDYYLGTRSESQRRQDANQFRSDIAALDRFYAQDMAEEFAPQQVPIQSGTPATFGSTMGYYSNRQNFIAPSASRLGLGSVGTMATGGSAGVGQPSRRR